MLRRFCRDKLSQALGPYSRLRARCFLLEIDLCLRKAQWHGEYACMHSTNAAEPLCLICFCFSNIRQFTRHLWHTRAHKLPDLTTSRDQKRKHFLVPILHKYTHYSVLLCLWSCFLPKFNQPQLFVIIRLYLVCYLIYPSFRWGKLHNLTWSSSKGERRIWRKTIWNEFIFFLV